jgi:hypothetical protein
MWRAKPVSLIATPDTQALLRFSRPGVKPLRETESGLARNALTGAFAQCYPGRAGTVQMKGQAVDLQMAEQILRPDAKSVRKFFTAKDLNIMPAARARAM